jgi:hypothetical protein
MTEREWLACPDPHRLLAHLDCLPGDRKLLLYGVACCRSHWSLLTKPASRRAVEWAERFADGEVQRDEPYARLEYESEGAAFALEMADGARRYDQPEEAIDALNFRGELARDEGPSRVAAAYLANALLTIDTCAPYDPTFSAHRSLLLVAPLRDIFGSPFHPVTVAPAWRADRVLALARQMYESRDFSAMPILADALQDAGCDSADILDHCRGPGEHVRGCWVVDLVLGRS